MSTGAPLHYLSWPRFGGLVASYVFSILSIVRLPSRIMYFSAPPFACVFAMYVPFHTGLFVACFRAGFFSFSFPPGRARLGGFLRINTLSFTATPPLKFSTAPINSWVELAGAVGLVRASPWLLGCRSWSSPYSRCCFLLRCIAPSSSSLLAGAVAAFCRSSYWLCW